MAEAIPCVDCPLFRTEDGRGNENGFLVNPDNVEQDFPRLANKLRECSTPRVHMARRYGALGLLGFKREARGCPAFENAIHVDLFDEEGFRESQKLMGAINESVFDFFGYPPNHPKYSG